MGADMSAFEPTRFFEYRGSRMSLGAACRAAGRIVTLQTAFMRVNQCGWSVEDAVETSPFGTPKGGSRKKKSTVDTDALRKLWETRLPDKLVADRLGVTMGAMRRQARNMGLISRRLIWAQQL